jgi:type II secretory pathway predicted ATPase ExeA
VYLRFFNLRESPFNLTPDPRFLFLSAQHEEALTHLLYGIYERKGFIEITGEVGTGKTMLCRALLERLDNTVSTALIFNSYLTKMELLQAITDDFGLQPHETTSKGYIDVLNEYLLGEFAAGRNAVVVLDEAWSPPCWNSCACSPISKRSAVSCYRLFWSGSRSYMQNWRRSRCVNSTSALRYASIFMS